MSSLPATDTSDYPPIASTCSTADFSSVPTPASTPADSPLRTTAPSIPPLRTGPSAIMDEAPIDDAAAGTDQQETEAPASAQVTDERVKTAAAKKKAKCCAPKHKKKCRSSKRTSHGKKSLRHASSSESISDGESESDESSDSLSEEDQRKKKAAKLKKSKQASRKRRKAKSKKQDSDSDSDAGESEESDSTSNNDTARRKKKFKRVKKAARDTETDDVATDGEDDVAALQLQLQELSLKFHELRTNPKSPKSALKRRRSSVKSVCSTKRKSKKSDALEYKRVDQLWDSTIHNYKLKESAEDEESEFAEYAFLVRRRFDWENKFQNTVVDIKSKQLRSVLAEVMKECKSVSLEAEEPTVDPNLLFMYLEDLRTYYKKSLKSKIKAERKRKVLKKLEQQRATCKMLVQYIDEDYADTKKTLYPLLAAGNITFDLVWALFTPNDVAITSCYGAWDEPRCFKVDYAMKYQTVTRGEWYCVEGKYMEYDGKNFGLGDFEVDVESFKGPRKITSLAAYPLKFHKDPASIKKQIVARGETFVQMEGMQYRSHKGLAFMKKKKAVLKIHINGRVIIDPASFRRVNPNYPISLLKPTEADDLCSDSEDDDCPCCDDSSPEEDALGGDDRLEHDEVDGVGTDPPKFKYKRIEGEHGDAQLVAVAVGESGEPIRSQRMETLEKRTYTEEQLLLTSPVVLGFAFSEKLWLEFSLSGVHEIAWNDDAYDSLVLPDDKKTTVRALVESHKYHPAKAIDDVIQGKGKGLVFVLHGPPGTGKTLTAESISELLRCPLYIVSAGELGTDPARLEQELQKILDIAHSWGALLLLDEADVFLEKREVHDIHRNALVSIFLRLLEYFQGILFLTTNRVETFDDAFQSRIHVALRYDELTGKARREIWKNFIGRVRKQGELYDKSNNTKDVIGVEKFSEEDFVALSRHRLNGRQIKNMARTAQALAINEGQKLTMGHIKRVLDVAETFDRDLKGGVGYLDAMRSYT